LRLSAFRYAASGVWLLLRREPNARVHLALAAIALWAVWTEELAAVEAALVAAVIALVLGLEAANSALEHAVDLACPQRDPRAKAAKDLAAGAVLVAAAGALAVAVLLFWPRRHLLWLALGSPRALWLLVPVALLASAWWGGRQVRGGHGRAP
jgi:diacylglycerol kinase